ncbi:MAG: hypothetical protein M1132_10605 [Chloroflexi bacterium]|nr:hypothetical protein [Chloroflexota bacterium]
METMMNTIGELALVGAGPVVVVAPEEMEAAGQKENALEFAAPKASFVAFATDQPTTEYTTEADVCQGIWIPTFDEIEAIIAGAAQRRIESAFSEVQDTRARIERERMAREMALQTCQSRLNETKTALAKLGDERTSMEQRARAFLGGEELKTLLEKIHIAFNARQLQMETTLSATEAEVAESTTEAQAASVSDSLELQLLEQELERLELAAPDVAENVRLVATAVDNLSAARQAIEEGLLRDAVVLIEQAKAGQADPSLVAEVEQVLAEAQQAKLARHLIARITANPDQPGALRRIHQLMEEAQHAGVEDKVKVFADRALETARDAANARFAQARPIADHLVSEGFVPVVGDGRIEAWMPVARNGHGEVWSLDRILTLRGREEWITETPRNPITRRELPLRVRHSRWYRAAVENPAG